MKQKLLIFSLLLTTSMHAQQLVSGYVYEDVNKNGKKERSEKGITGVAVSNGVQVVQTDEKGKYELPLLGDELLFIIKPANYAVLLDDYNLARSYIANKPQGSPSDFKYSGFEPTKPLPKSVDFGLIPQKETEEFTAFIFGDPQPYTLEEMDYFKRVVVDEVKNNVNGELFGISLGDIVGDDLSLHQAYKSVMKEIGLPWYNVMGNHDMNYDAKEDRYSDETFEKNFGPANYAFNYGDAHFIILDDILYPHPVTGKGYLGGFRPDQLEFVKNNLKFVDKNKLIVVSLHIPLFVGDEESHFDSQSRTEFLSLLKDYANVLILSAHTHFQMQQFYTEQQGWKGSKPLHSYNVGTTSGDWYSGELDSNGIPVSTMRDGTPRGYAYLKVKGNQYELDYKVAGKPSDYRMEIFTPKVVSDKGAGSALIYANIFMGTEKDKVEYRVDNGNWKKMEKAVTYDPSFYAAVLNWDLSDTLLSGRRPSNPEQCAHLWSGRLPNGLSIGNHTIEVRVMDMFGKEYSNTTSYRVEEKK